MKKRLKKLSIIIMVLFIFCSSKSFLMISEAAQEPVYYSDMFYAYPYHLKATSQSEATGMEYFADYQLIYAYNQAVNSIYSLSSEDEAMMTVITSLKNGVEYTFSELGSALGLTDNFETRTATRATQQLLSAVMQDSSLMLTIAEESEELKEAWESIVAMDDFMTSGTYAYLTDSQKETVKDALDEHSDVMSAVSDIVTVAEAAGYICFMECVDEAVLSYLIDVVDNQSLLDSLEKYRSYKESNYQQYIAEKYISETTLEVMNSAIENIISGAGSSAVAIWKVLDIIFEATGTGLSWVTGLGTNEDLVVSMLLQSYVNDFINKRMELINDFMTNPVTPSMIQEYKLTYCFYISGVRALAESVKDLNSAHKGLMNNAISNIEKYVSFEKHLEGCTLAVENLPMEERNVVKGNPELFYQLQGDIKISEPSDDIESGTIYFANGQLYYGINAVDANITFDNTDVVRSRGILGNLNLTKSNITIPECLQLYVGGNLQCHMKSSGTYYISNLVLEGKLHVRGNMKTTSGYGQLHMTMQGEKPILQVDGNVNDYGNSLLWSVSSGEIIFNGSSINTPKLSELGTAKLTIRTDGCADITLGMLKVESNADNEDGIVSDSIPSPYSQVESNADNEDAVVAEPMVLDITQSGDGYHVVNGSLNTHCLTLTSSSNIRITDSLSVGSLDLTEADINIHGEMYVSGNLQSKMRLSGQDCTSHLVLEGKLHVSGNMERTSYGHLSMTMQGDHPILQVDGNVNVYGDKSGWSVSSGEIIFNGSSIYAPQLSELGAAKLTIRTDGCADITLGMLKVESNANNEDGSVAEPMVLDITKSEDGYYEVNGSLNGYGLTSSSNIQITDSLSVGSLELSFTDVLVSGILNVKANCRLIEAVIKIPGEMYVGGNLSSSTSVSGRYCISELLLEGKLHVSGNMINAISYGQLRMTMQGDHPILQVDGNVDVDGTYSGWSVSSGEIIFNGSSINAPKLSELGTAKLTIRTDGCKDITLGMLKVESNANNEDVSVTEPMVLDITQSEDGYHVVNGSLNGHGLTLTSSSNIQITDSLSVGNLELSFTDVLVSGILNVEANCRLIEAVIKIPGEMYVGGNLYFSTSVSGQYCTSVLLLEGKLHVSGNMINGTSYGRLNMTMQGDYPILQVDGNVNVYGNYTGSTITVTGANCKLKFSGDVLFSGNNDLRTAEIELCGTKKQTVGFGYHDDNPILTMTLNNTSEEGIEFTYPINMQGLFNHNGCKFSLYNGGSSSSFIDYDGDGITDEKDEYPLICKHEFDISDGVDPTCTESGYIDYVCIHCEDPDVAYREEIPALGHDYEVVITEPTTDSKGVCTYTCKVCDYEKQESLDELSAVKFLSGAVTLYDNFAVKYKVSSSLFDGGGYSDPYVKFVFNGVETIVSEYEYISAEGIYVFEFSDIAPHQMNDTIYATLYVKAGDKEYASETKEYSVAKYCYNMLKKCDSDEYSELRTLLVDLLNYGAVAQNFTNYKTDDLVNAALTEEQVGWGTTEEPELISVLDQKYTVIENPTVTWKGAGLTLTDSVTMRFKLAAENLDNLKVKLVCGDNEWIISSDAFVETEGGYYVFFDGLNAGQMSDEVYLTVYDGETAVSNTIRYSIESYAYAKQNSSDANLAELVKAMMKYGDSAREYIN